MIGIVIAAGSGTRLHPSTVGVSKHLLPVYDKPMIYYPLSTLMLAGIKEIIIVVSPSDRENYVRCLGNGNKFGLRLSYVEQNASTGVAAAIRLCREFIENKVVMVVLGDNIFYGPHFSSLLKRAIKNNFGATIFCSKIQNPKRFGILELDSENKPKIIIEKPPNTDSTLAVTGLYIYNTDLLENLDLIKPSKRGELEVTDLNNIYLIQQKINVEVLPRGFTWLDAGTHDSLLNAGNLIKSIENQTGYKIGCLEEISLRNGWNTKDMLFKALQIVPQNKYYQYVNKLIR